MADTAEQTENQEQEKSTEQKSTEQKDGDNQKAIDDAVAAAKEKWEKEVEEKLKTLSKALLDNLSKEQYREVMLNVIANEGMENV